MNKLYVTIALAMSLVLGSGFAISGNSVLAQNYGYEDDYSDNGYSDDGYGDDQYNKYGDSKRFDFNFYVVADETPYVESGPGFAILESTATCDENDEVTGGGFELLPVDETGDQPDAEVVVSKPFENAEEGWTAVATTDATTAGSQDTTFSLTAYAVCFDEKPKHTTNFMSSLS